MTGAPAPGPFVHVLVPTFGRPSYLSDLLASIEEHVAGPEIAVTVVDDASPGGDIAAVVARYPGVEYVRNAVNLGISENFNRCIDLSRGEYTVLAGSDDAFRPGYVPVLQRMRDAVGDAEVLAPGVQVMDVTGRVAVPLADRVKRLIAPRASDPDNPHLISGDAGMARLLVGNYLYFPALAWRTDVLRSLRFDPAYAIALDFDLITRMLDAGGRIAYVDAPAVFSYRRHGASASQTTMLGANARFAEEREVHRMAVAMARRRGWRRSVVLGSLQPTSRLNYLLMKLPRSRRTISRSGPPAAGAPPGMDSPGYTRRLAAAQRPSLRTMLGAHLPYRAHITSLRLGRTLEIGCGTGRVLRWLAPGSVGVDTNAVSVDFARSIGLSATSPEELARGGVAEHGMFDSLLLSHVLEHLHGAEADAVLAQYLPFLRPGGRVVTITPQERGHRSDPTHVAWLDATDVAAMLQRHGLRMERQYSFPLPRAAGPLFTHNETVVIARRPIGLA